MNKYFIIVFFVLSFLKSNAQNKNKYCITFYYNDIKVIDSNIKILLFADEKLISVQTAKDTSNCVYYPDDGLIYNVLILSDCYNNVLIKKINSETNCGLVLSADKYYHDTVRYDADKIGSFIWFGEGPLYDEYWLYFFPYSIYYRKSFDCKIIFADIPYFNWNFFTKTPKLCDNKFKSNSNCNIEVLFFQPKNYIWKSIFLKLTELWYFNKASKKSETRKNGKIEFDILSYIKHRRDYYIFRDSTYFKAFAYIKKNNSYVCDTCLDEKELKYHQVKFMICELYVRKLRYFLSNYNSVYIYKRRKELYSLMQANVKNEIINFENATDNGNNFEAVLNWYYDIGNHLKKFPKKKFSVWNYDYADDRHLPRIYIELDSNGRIIMQN